MKKLLLIILMFFLLSLGAYSYHSLQKDKISPYLTLYSATSKLEGIDQQSALLLEDFKDHFTLACFPSQQIHRFKRVPKSIRSYITDHQPIESPVLLVQEMLWSPHHSKEFQKNLMHRNGQQLRISYSLFNATKIPQEWVFILNHYFDAVAVPNLFLANVYQKSGVKIPIFELSVPMKLQPFFKQPLKEKPHLPFVFASMGPCENRSNHLVLIRAFAKAFGNNKDVCLKINASHSDSLLRQFLQWEIDRLGLENVSYTELSHSFDSYLDFFNSIDCYVTVSKGEGFSTAPREAMAMGIPVIATNNTDQATLCETGLVLSLASNYVQQARHPSLGNLACGNFFSCDQEELTAALHTMYKNYNSYLAKGAAARAWVAQYDHSQLKAFYLNLVKPQQVLLGEENRITPTTLITNSPSLYQKYLNLKT